MVNWARLKYIWPLATLPLILSAGLCLYCRDLALHWIVCECKSDHHCQGHAYLLDVLVFASIFFFCLFYAAPSAWIAYALTLLRFADLIMCSGFVPLRKAFFNFCAYGFYGYWALVCYCVHRKFVFTWSYNAVLTHPLPVWFQKYLYNQHIHTNIQHISPGSFQLYH